MLHENTLGRLLIATPAIGDGIFDQAVVYMLHHDEDGALGVIINRPSELPVADLLPRWADLVVEPPVIFGGGPVSENGFIGVARAIGDQPQDVVRVPGTDYVTIDLEADPALVGAHVDQLRIFRGYAGWGAGQLDAELRADAWFTVDAHADDMWSTSPHALYERVLLRQRGELRWYANAPTDPSLN